MHLIARDGTGSAPDAPGQAMRGERTSHVTSRGGSGVTERPARIAFLSGPLPVGPILEPSLVSGGRLVICPWGHHLLLAVSPSPRTPSVSGIGPLQLLG